MGEVFWTRVRKKNNSYYVTIPSDYAKSLMKHQAGLSIVGQEVKVEVTL